jgi:cytochrome b6-f complex iron-sulfur subunit
MSNMTEPIPEGGQGLTRRELFNYIWIGSVGLLAIQVAGIGIYFALPRFREGEFGGRFKAGPVVELPSPGDPPLNVPNGKFWLVRTEHYLLALYKACTHLDCLFDWNPHENKFICPCHGSQFARNGQWLSGPAPRSLDQFAVQIVSPTGEVLARTESGKGLRMPPIAPVKPPDSQDEGATVQPAEISEAVGIPGDSLVWVDTGHKLSGAPQKG